MRTRSSLTSARRASVARPVSRAGALPASVVPSRYAPQRGAQVDKTAGQRSRSQARAAAWDRCPGGREEAEDPRRVRAHAACRSPGRGTRVLVSTTAKAPRSKRPRGLAVTTSPQVPVARISTLLRRCSCTSPPSCPSRMRHRSQPIRSVRTPRRHPRFPRLPQRAVHRFPSGPRTWSPVRSSGFPVSRSGPLLR